MSDDDQVTTDPDVLRELGTQLPWHRPDADRREAMRSALLVAVSEGQALAPPRRWGLVAAGFAAGALAAAAIALVVARSPATTVVEPPRVAYAQIEASSAAELEHTRAPTATGTDETVRIRGGRIRLAVPEVRVGDRVRVQTGDASVEGRGSYEVVVVRDALASVTVTAGTASVTVRGQAAAVFLAAGQAWHAPVISAELALPAVPADPQAPGSIAAAPSPRVHAAPNARTTTTSDPAPAVAPSRPAVTAPSQPIGTFAPSSVTPEVPQGPSGPTATERHFQAGTALLRAGKAADAAIELGAAADAGTDALASDARYFQAVALERAGHAAQAETALVAFLDHAPTSIRRGRAAVLLGRLLRARGDQASARAWFEAAARDAEPAVAAAGRAGLASL